jgi:hypothetical protein
MRNWFKSLSIEELKTWIENFSSHKLLRSFLDNQPSDQDLEEAKQVLQDKIDLAIMLDQEDRKLLEDHEIWLDMVNNKG